MTLSFRHDEAYKLLLRFRHVPAAIAGFIVLSKANVFVTDVSASQAVIGSSNGQALEATVFNFSGSPYGELFDGLCALCSSSTPLITKHSLKSDDSKMVEAFLDSRLGLYCQSHAVKPGTSIVLTASVNYPL